MTDLNGDGRPDLVYFGDAKDLTVRYNLGTNGWSEPKRWHFEDGRMDANALATGDLNGDGLTDVALLGDNGAVYFLAQQKDHTLAEPVKIPYSGTPKALQIVDVDGDGRNDLFFVDFDNAAPFRVRLQNAGGQLGPEIYFKAQPIRSFWLDNLAGDRTNYLISIVQATGRAEVSQFTRKPAEPLSGAFKQGQFQILPLNKTEAAQRGVLWADVDGDGRADLLVAEPESGQLSVYLQQADGTLAAPKKFPSLAGVSQIAVSDWNNDGHPEIFLLSRDENSVAVTAVRQKRPAAVSHAVAARRQAAADDRRRAQARRQARPRRHRGQGRRALARHPHGGRQVHHAEIERQFQVESDDGWRFRT